METEGTRTSNDERTEVLLVDGRPVARVEVADTWLRRARGMLGRSTLPEALWLAPESSVHGVGMTRVLDVALLDEHAVVQAAVVLRPFGLTRPRRGVVAVVEAPVGSFARWGLTVGSTLARRPAPAGHAAAADPDA